MNKLFVLTFILIIIINIESVSAASNTITVCPSGCNNTIIQTAINSANFGDTILVKDGIYTENVIVNKSVSIKSENGANKTIISAKMSSNNVFEVTVDNVNITGFTMNNATDYEKSGIFLSNADNCNISKNIVSKNWYGIKINNSTMNFIINNTAISNTGSGISLNSKSDNNLLENNIAADNGGRGIQLDNSDGNNITNNYVSKNFFDGILLEQSTNNKLMNNTILDNKDVGIYMLDSFNNTIYNNTVSKDSIYLGHSTHNTFINNTIEDNDRGIFLGSSDPIF